MAGFQTCELVRCGYGHHAGYKLRGCLDLAEHYTQWRILVTQRDGLLRLSNENGPYLPVRASAGLIAGRNIASKPIAGRKAQTR